MRRRDSLYEEIDRKKKKSIDITLVIFALLMIALFTGYLSMIIFAIRDLIISISKFIEELMLYLANTLNS